MKFRKKPIVIETVQPPQTYPTPADGWDDRSAEVMNAEADADVADRLDRARPE